MILIDVYSLMIIFIFCVNSNCAGLSTKQLVKGQCSSINPCRSSPCSDDQL